MKNKAVGVNISRYEIYERTLCEHRHLTGNNVEYLVDEWFSSDWQSSESIIDSEYGEDLQYITPFEITQEEKIELKKHPNQD